MVRPAREKRRRFFSDQISLLAFFIIVDRLDPAHCQAHRRCHHVIDVASLVAPGDARHHHCPRQLQRGARLDAAHHDRRQAAPHHMESTRLGHRLPLACAGAGSESHISLVRLPSWPPTAERDRSNPFDSSPRRTLLTSSFCETSLIEVSGRPSFVLKSMLTDCANSSASQSSRFRCWERTSNGYGAASR